MSIWSVCGSVIICLIFIISFSAGKTKIGLTVSMGMCLMLFVSGIENLIPIVDFLKDLTSQEGDAPSYLVVLLKCAGVGIICSFTSETCRNAGEGAIASGVEFFGKSEIIILCMPVIRSLLNLVTGK